LEVKRLDWDSRFLGREVYSVILTRDDEVFPIATLVRTLEDAGASLAYLHLDHSNPSFHAQLTVSGAFLCDEKVTYTKPVQPVSSNPADAPGRPDLTVEAYQGGLTDELLGLAILAGHESRFRKDPRLLPHFEPLYRLWIINSLNRTMADIVYICRTGPAIIGMATARVREDGTGNIGLIATHTDYQGWGIGTELLRATDNFFRERKVLTTTVVTQRANNRACRFYEKAGFICSKTEFVYHLWLN
jgi:dTDP-4-amino-4,6-dideoxy-D-galactose acyltransferase